MQCSAVQCNSVEVVVAMSVCRLSVPCSGDRNRMDWKLLDEELIAIVEQLRTPFFVVAWIIFWVLKKKIGIRVCFFGEPAYCA